MTLDKMMAYIHTPIGMEWEHSAIHQTGQLENVENIHGDEVTTVLNVRPQISHMMTTGLGCATRFHSHTTHRQIQRNE